MKASERKTPKLLEESTFMFIFAADYEEYEKESVDRIAGRW